MRASCTGYMITASYDDLRDAQRCCAGVCRPQVARDWGQSFLGSNAGAQPPFFSSLVLSFLYCLMAPCTFLPTPVLRMSKCIMSPY